MVRFRRRSQVGFVLGLVVAVAIAVLAIWLGGRHGDTARGPVGAAGTPTLAPGSALPSGEECAARVRPAQENRPGNRQANRTVVRLGDDYEVPPWGPDTNGMAPAAAALSARIDGGFAGTTDELIQWASCKWGLDTDTVRAIAVVESEWRQGSRGDEIGGVPQSFGLLQVKRTAQLGTYPASMRSTAWNLDYGLAYVRACFEGLIAWLGDEHPEYRAGDEWGCIGHHYSGGWHDPDADTYAAKVREERDRGAWRLPGF